jgi:hypothetical protein
MISLNKNLVFIIFVFFILFSCNSVVENKSTKNNDKSAIDISREGRLKAMTLVDSIYKNTLAADNGSITEQKLDSLNSALMKMYFEINSTLKSTDTLLLYRYRERKFSELRKLGNNWEYDSTENKMGEKVKFARVSASELVFFDFPYSGGSTGAITIRKKRGDLDIYFTISRGQIDTDIDETYIRVKFDNEKPVNYSMSEADDGSSDILFFNNKSSLLKKIRKSKRMVVEVPFYQNGVKQFEFRIRNLNW